MNETGAIKDLKSCVDIYNARAGVTCYAHQTRQTVRALRDAIKGARAAFREMNRPGMPESQVVIAHKPSMGIATKFLYLAQLPAEKFGQKVTVLGQTSSKPPKHFVLQTKGGYPIRNPADMPLQYRIKVQKGDGRKLDVSISSNWDNRPL